MKNSFFKEKQSFITWWLIMLVFGLLLVTGYALMQIVNVVSISSFAIILSIAIYLLFVRLHTSIDENGIEITFFPFATKLRWHWSDIAHISIVKYSFSDYGGWGYRRNSTTIAYTTKGKFGIELILKSGKRFMVGTQHPDKIENVIKNKL